MDMAWGAVVGDLGPSFALVQRQPDSPFGDILGYVIVFVVVIWPIIRGLLGNAKEQRKKHEQQQRGAGGRPKPRDVPGRSRLDAFIEEMVSGQRARVDVGDAEAHVSTETAASIERAVTVVEAPPPIPRRRAAHGPGQSTRTASAARPERLSKRTAAATLGGDLFDRSRMDRDLVPDSALTHLESENEAEVMGTHTQSIERLALSESAVETNVTSDLQESALVRVHRGRTPWQAAFVLREVLGPPGGLRSSVHPYR